MKTNLSSKRSPLGRGSAWCAGLALALLATITLGRCGALPGDGSRPADRCAESGIDDSIGNEFMSPDGLYVCICELDGTLVCRRMDADAGPTNVAGMAADR
jgi:hypothetical protein